MQYQLITRRLRWSNGPGLGDTVVERPWDKTTRQFTDDPDGTLVEIPPDAPMNVPLLLETGAIAELPPAAAPPDRKERANG